MHAKQGHYLSLVIAIILF